MMNNGTDKVMVVLDSEIESCRQRLGRFQDRLKKDPEYAFTRADDAIHAVAQLSLYLPLKKGLENGIDVKVALMQLTANALSTLRVNATGLAGSTSTSSRAVAQAKVAVASNILNATDTGGDVVVAVIRRELG